MIENFPLVIDDKLSDSKVTFYTFTETTRVGKNSLLKYTEIAVMKETGSVQMNVELKDRVTKARVAGYTLYLDPRKAIDNYFLTVNGLKEFDFFMSGEISIKGKPKDEKWTENDIHPWSGMSLLHERLNAQRLFIDILIELEIVQEGKVICCLVSPRSTTRKTEKRNNPDELGRWTELVMERFNREHIGETYVKSGRNNDYVRYIIS